MTLLEAILSAQTKHEKKYSSPPPEVTDVPVIKKKQHKRELAKVPPKVDCTSPCYLANRMTRELPVWASRTRDLYYENVKLLMAIKMAHFNGKVDSRWSQLPPPSRQYYERRLHAYKRIARENKLLYKLIINTPSELETASSLDREWAHTKLRIIHMSQAAFVLFPFKIEEIIEDPAFFAPPEVKRPRFYQKFQISGCIGSVDGTFVAMIRPKVDEERYYCRKGYHSRNIELIVDADLNILHVDASYGGSFHDSYIFNNSSIKTHLEQLNNTNETVFLLGDSGYSQRPYMMVPVPNAIDGTPEALYNKIHASARNSVERAIGILKGRFRCLLVHRVLHYDPIMVGKIVIACCVLHNICNRAGLPAPQLTAEDTEMERSLQPQHSVIDDSRRDLDRGRAARNEIIRTLWRNARR